MGVVGDDEYATDVELDGAKAGEDGVGGGGCNKPL